MTTDDRLVSGASSLNPNKSSGDIGERLRKYASARWAIQYEHDEWLEEAAAEIERLRRDMHLMGLERDRIARNRDMWKGQCERQADQLRQRSALTAESAVAGAYENAAKIAETFFFNDIGKLTVGPSIQDGIASAIRAAGAKKTAESGHSPSTHNSESE